MTSFYGRHITGDDSCFGIADYSDSSYPNLRATVFSAMPSDGHAYAMGILAGYYDAGDPATLILMTYDTSGGNPDDLLGETDPITISSRMVDVASGTYYEADLQSAFLLQDGSKYALAFNSYNGDVAHGQNCDGSLIYFRQYSPHDAPDPMNYSHASNEGKLAICLLYEPNVGPTAPDNFSPADGDVTTDTTPTLSADFNDANITLPNGLQSDYMSKYQVQVRSVSAANATTGTVVHDSGTVVASSTEKANDRATYTLASALTAGVRYQFRYRMQDRFSVWSPWSHADGTAWSDFLVSSAGVVTLDGTPNGRTTDTTPDLQGRWSHGTAQQMTHVQAKLYLGSNSSALKTSPEYDIANVNSAAAPGTLFTFAAANHAWGTLASGTAYQYAIRGKDALGVWSEYSARRTFFTNASPGIPTNLVPTGSAASSIRPLLTCRATDPDGDSLTVSARIKDSGGSLLQTRTMTYDATLYSGVGGYKYQTISGDLATFGTFKWDAVATDGDLTSAYSAESTFVYADGPVVTVTAPTEAQVITTDTPTVTWTVTGQVKKQIRVYRTFDDVLIHDSGLVVDATASYTLPADILMQSVGSYYLTVAITNAAPLVGTSAARNFSLVYTAPATIVDFVASPEYGGFDTQPSAVRLTWVTPSTDPGAFEGFVVKRRTTGDSISNAVTIALLMSLDQTSWVDWFPVSGVEQTYSIQQLVRESSVDLLTSEPAESGTVVSLLGSVVNDVRNGGGLRAVFESVQSRKSEDAFDQTFVSTWGGGPDWLLEGVKEQQSVTMTANVRRTDAATVGEITAALRALAAYRTDGSAVLACYRDERGRKFFGRVLKPVISDVRLMRQDVDFQFQELDYDEAVS